MYNEYDCHYDHQPCACMALRGVTKILEGLHMKTGRDSPVWATRQRFQNRNFYRCLEFEANLEKVDKIYARGGKFSKTGHFFRTRKDMALLATSSQRAWKYEPIKSMS